MNFGDSVLYKHAFKLYKVYKKLSEKKIDCFLSTTYNYDFMSCGSSLLQTDRRTNLLNLMSTLLRCALRQMEKKRNT